MKNYKLWLVVGILFLGTATVFFILWYKERKKSDMANLKIAITPKKTAVEAGATATPPIEVTESQVGDTARSIVQETPAFFGSRVS